MARPKLEFEVTVPTGGWAVSANSGSGAQTCTVPAATYYLSTAGSGSRSLLAELEYQLETSASGSWSVTIDNATDAGTGKVSIGCTTGWSLNWTSTDLRDLLGFTGNLASGIGSTEVAPLYCGYQWLPNVGCFGRGGSLASDGWLASDQVVTRARSGRPCSTVNNRWTEEQWTFRGLTTAKTWRADEAYARESAEYIWTFYMTAGIPFRFYQNRAASYVGTYIYSGGPYHPTRMRDGYDGAWEWSMAAFVDV